MFLVVLHPFFCSLRISAFGTKLPDGWTDRRQGRRSRTPGERPRNLWSIFTSGPARFGSHVWNAPPQVFPRPSWSNSAGSLSDGQKPFTKMAGNTLSTKPGKAYVHFFDFGSSSIWVWILFGLVERCLFGEGEGRKSGMECYFMCHYLWPHRSDFSLFLSIFQKKRFQNSGKTSSNKKKNGQIKSTKIIVFCEEYSSFWWWATAHRFGSWRKVWKVTQSKKLRDIPRNFF